MNSMLVEQEPDTQDSPSGEDEERVWRAFAAASTDAEFCQAWLALLCRQLRGVSAGVVLLQADDLNTFLPAAVWPEAGRDLSFLGTAAQRALVEGRGVVHRPDDASGESRIHVAYPAGAADRKIGAVVLEASARTESEILALLRQLHWGIAWLRELFLRRELAGIEGKGERIGSVMEVLATALRSGSLQQILFDLSNHIARNLHCSRVAIGLAKNGKIRVAALSNAAWFEKNARMTGLYVAAMEEAHDKLAPLAYQRPTAAQTESAAIQDSAHARLARESGTQSILSVPLLAGAECIAVLTLERNTEVGFEASEMAWVETLAALLPAAIDQKRKAERGYLAHLKDDSRKLLARLFGPRYLIWKFSASLFLAVSMALAFVEVDYRVSARTFIEGEVQRAAVAPFEGFVAASHVRAGDAVRQGQVLCELDDRDLRLEQYKWESEREQHSRKLREAMANHELGAIQVLSAQVRQAEAQLALANDRLKRVKIIAPFDGIVISGDLSQLIGSPVESGKKLFEIAPLHAYRVILQVDERDMRHVRLGQSGKLMISGVVGESIPLTVNKVTPVATAQDGRNFFRVEAKLKQVPAHLRPGMEGIGKIETGDRNLWWLLTHSFTDWLRLSLWNWLP